MADALVSRVVEVLLSFPGFLLALAVTGIMGPGLRSLLVVMVFVSWAGYARLVRGLIVAERAKPYLESARAAGVGNLRIVSRHLLPNISAPVIVLTTLDMGGILLGLAGLSFLGLGVQPPTAEWGAMLSEAKTYLGSAPQTMLYPGGAIFLMVLGFNLLGDGLRDMLDPRPPDRLAASPSAHVRPPACQARVMTLSVGRWVAITVLAAMTLAACGGDPGPRNAAPSGSVPALADGTIPWVNEPARDEDFQVGAPRRRKAGPQARSCRAGQLVAVLPEWLPKGDTDDGTPRSAARGLIGLVRVTNTGEQECSLQGEVPTTLFTGGRPAQVRSTHSVNDEARARVTAIAPDEVATLRLDWSARTAVRR